MTGPATGAGDPQGGADAQGQAPTTSTGQAPAAESGQAPAAGAGTGTASTSSTGDGETAEQRADRLEAELANVRREAASHRTKATQLEREQQQREQATMTEAERAAARAATLEQENGALKAQLQGQALEAAAITAATKLNFRNPELAVRLLDRAAIEFDTDGKARGVEQQLRDLAKREPYLVRAGNGADFGGGQQGASADATPNMNELLRAAFRG